MVGRRSFSNKVTGSDGFAELSFEAQALYLQLSMTADDEGFVSAPKKVQRGIGASINALDELEEKGYLVFFDTGACVIAHWNQNNHINEKRRKATVHAEELSLLWLDENGVYHMYEDVEGEERDELAEIETKTEAEAEKPTCMQTAYKLHANCMQTACKTPAPLFSPPFSPLSSFPQTPIYYSPYNPPQNAPTPLSSSFDILFKARAQALAVKYWGRKLRKYEKAEIFETSVDFVHLKGREVQLSLSDVELLEIAFKASADAGAPNVSYIRGVYSNWRQKRIFTPDDYWENEVKRDHVVI